MADNNKANPLQASMAKARRSCWFRDHSALRRAGCGTIGFDETELLEKGT